MSKEEDTKFLKIQTCVLKVNIHCDGCKQKVKKLLQKIDGVYTTTIDAEQGKVTVSGNVDPAILIKKLVKNGKHAELLAPKLNNNNNKNQQQLNNQFQKLQLDNGKGGQKDNGAKGGQKGGAGGNNNQNGQQQLQAIQQQMKGFDLGRLKDLKMPFMKDPKSVKFNIPEDGDEGSDFDDEFDDDDDYDDIDESDDDFEEVLKQIKTIKPMNGGMPVGNALVNDKKCGGGGNGGNNGKKGGGGGDVLVQNKVVVVGNDGKNGNPDGKKGGGGQNEGKNGNGGQEGKNGSGNNNKGGGIPNNNPGGKKGGKNELNGGNNPYSVMAGSGYPAGVNMMPLQMGGGGGNFSMHPMAHMGNTATAVQGLLANGGIPQGYFPGGPGMPPPEVIAAGNSYQQQQYLAAMMQQQRMMMNGPDRTFQPMAYARPPVPINYMPQPPEYTHLFSDENTSSCSIM